MMKFVKRSPIITFIFTNLKIMLDLIIIMHEQISTFCIKSHTQNYLIKIAKLKASTIATFYKPGNNP